MKEKTKYLLSEIEKWNELTDKWFPNGAIKGGKAATAVIIGFDAHVRLLEQPLKVGDFVPADEEGKVLKMPWGISDELPIDEYNAAMAEYAAALFRVKFEGFAADIDSDDEMFIRGYGLRLFIDDRGVCYEHSLGIIKSISDLCGLGLKIKG